MADWITRLFSFGSKLKNLPEKKLIKIINILGQETSQSGLNVNVFDDGSVEKKYIIK